MIIIHEGDLFRVTAVHHLTPGNKRGFMQTKMKNLRTGIGTEYKFRSEDRVDQAILDNRQMQYLYAEGDMVIALWEGRAVATDGKPYTNTYSWYMKVSNGKIVEVTAFFESKDLDDIWNRIPDPQQK